MNIKQLPDPYDFATKTLVSSRRTFLKNLAAAAGFSAAQNAVQGQAVDHPIRDRLWMWGHDTGSLKNTYGFGSGGGTIMPGEALRYMGIPNVCMVRFTGTPHPPFDD